MHLKIWASKTKESKVKSSDSFTSNDGQKKKEKLTDSSFVSLPLSVSISVSLSGKRIRTSLITAEKITSTTSARPSAPRKWMSILKMKR